MPAHKKMEIMVPEKPMTRKEFITALETFKAKQPIYVPEPPKQSTPWGIYIMLLFGFAILAVAFLWGLSTLKADPTPFYPTPIIISFPTAERMPTETKIPTITLTPTKDIMVDMAVINNYYALLKSGDMESAWNCLTLKFRRDSWGNDFEEFKKHWSRTGPVAVYEIIPEKESGGEAVALVRLYFYFEQRIRYYRFYLQYNPLDKIYQIDRVENARPW